MVTDRNLIEQLRTIFQTAQKHQPLPPGTNLDGRLEMALENIAKIAADAVRGYRPA
jgi:hypothetical protein